MLATTIYKFADYQRDKTKRSNIILHNIDQRANTKLVTDGADKFYNANIEITKDYKNKCLHKLEKVAGECTPRKLEDQYKIPQWHISSQIEQSKSTSNNDDKILSENLIDPGL